VWEKIPYRTVSDQPGQRTMTAPQTCTNKIECNIEKACQRLSKFYYQVFLPHYRNNRNFILQLSIQVGQMGQSETRKEFGYSRRKLQEIRKEKRKKRGEQNKE